MRRMKGVGIGEYQPGTDRQNRTLIDSSFVSFYYADERHADGRLKGLELDGNAHGDFYAQLAAHEGSVPWHSTFVKGEGYTKF